MSELEKDLLEMFEIRNRKAKEIKILNLEVNEAQKDIRLLTLMFSDGVPDVSIPLNDKEILIWDSKVKKILYSLEGNTQFLEAAEKKVIVRLCPHLKCLVKKANEIFSE